MIITIDDAELETRLRAAAAARGEDPNQYALAVIARAVDAEEEQGSLAGQSERDPDDLTDQEIAEIRQGIRRGLAAADAGRVTPLEEWAARLRRDYNLPA